ncbi:MAG: hypothetical protein KatS3mg096_317 [Candidatus Parcubacteria bacterium]|nr:MAG: hypothetical protein KatS3mg096_317 [Candidatus Parcubacteria bacterium]
MQKNLIITIVLLVILLGVGYYFFAKLRSPSLTPELPQPPVPSSLEIPSNPTTPTMPITSVEISTTSRDISE